MTTDRAWSTELHFDPFVRQIAPRLLNFFARRVSQLDDAGDCLGETLLVLWRRRKDLPSHEDERAAWAFGVAHGVLLNHRRTALRRMSLTARLREELVIWSATTEQINPAAEQLRSALSAIRPGDRDLVLLVAWEGFSLQEAASILGIRPAAARARYSRARARLRTLLSGGETVSTGEESRNETRAKQ
ncbi:RNA polymerase sigma factor [Herbiconiux liangxiaofengii]|uniref:RNA polymerase sigma factor n=1 Tax=Herbiconiux liangxiaofengii TaxID=3342795 RepID=UPI0035BB5130